MSLQVQLHPHIKGGSQSAQIVILQPDYETRQAILKAIGALGWLNVLHRARFATLDHENLVIFPQNTRLDEATMRRGISSILDRLNIAYRIV